MEIRKLQYIHPDTKVTCFRCCAVAAEYRVTMAVGEHGGKILVCLCESCAQLPETELYTHFAGNTAMALNDREKNLLIAALQAESRALKADNAELYSICESLEIANAEKNRVLSNLINEALLRGGTTSDN